MLLSNRAVNEVKFAYSNEDYSSIRDRDDADRRAASASRIPGKGPFPATPRRPHPTG